MGYKKIWIVDHNGSHLYKMPLRRIIAIMFRDWKKLIPIRRRLARFFPRYCGWLFTVGWKVSFQSYVINNDFVHKLTVK